MSVSRAHRSVAVLATLLAASTVGLGAVTSAQAASVCGPATYAAPIATTTKLSLDRSVAEYGFVNLATIRVTSGAGTPSGTVRTTVAGITRTDGLSHLGATLRELPRRLEAGHTYRVSTSYNGNGTCAASGPVSKFYTVVRARTHVRGLEARDVRTGGRPHVSGRVASSTGITPNGKVRVTLTHDGTAKHATVRLRGGRFSVTFGRTSARGTWKVKAAMVRNGDYRGSSNSTNFRVGK
jgi:hypothetical protein